MNKNRIQEIMYDMQPLTDEEVEADYLPIEVTLTRQEVRLIGTCLRPGKTVEGFIVNAAILVANSILGGHLAIADGVPWEEMGAPAENDIPF